MDYTNNTTQSPKEHNKVKWIIVFVACLIVLVAVLSVMKNKKSNLPQSDMTPEERLIDSMTAKSPSNLTETEKQELIKSSTAKSSNGGLTVEQKQKLMESMTVKQN